MNFKCCQLVTLAPGQALALFMPIYLECGP